MTKVLVVDDDDLYGELTAQRLESAGYEVVFQHGPFGGNNLHAARKGAFDVVILDVNMPGLSGTGLLDLMRKSGPGARFILCSSMDERTLAELAKKHGANAWFCKTRTTGEIVDIVRALVPPEVKKAR